ncbi:MAG: hypothetical protein KH452_11860 [Clostridiales bacterium]|nr:hypothetical protein [Clostridiales bacterium]
MVQEAKKVNFYRLALRRGKRYRMELTQDDRLTGEGGGYFAYLAPAFDCGDTDGTWHRLCLDGSFQNCKYEVVAAASNVDLTEELSGEEVSAADWQEILKQHSHVRRVNTDDMLLHGLTGRYLWICIGVFGAAVDSSFRLEGFRAEFPGGSFTEYLPEIYQASGRNSFFDRYMAVLQSMYEDLEREVDQIPRYLDYETAPDENLPLFAGWTGNWDRGRGFLPVQMRYLLRHLQEIQCGRGTKEVMIRMIRLCTGREAMVVEYFKWHDWMKAEAGLLENYERLFGRNEDTFTVIVNMADAKEDLSGRDLAGMLEDYTPFGMHCNVVLLDWNSHLDQHCYLDKNSCLSTPALAKAEGFALGGNYILG